MLVVVEAVLALEVVVHLFVDDAVRDGDVNGRQKRVEHLVTGLDALLEALRALDLGAQVGLQLVERVEGRGQLGELVVELGELALLDRLDLDGALGVLALVLATGQRRREGGLLAGLEAGERLVEAFEHRARADLVGDAGDGVDLVAVDRGGQVDGDEVALLGLALDALERAEALTQLGDALFEVGVADLDRVDLDLEGVEGGELDLGADVDLSGERQALALFEREVGDVDLGLTERLDVVLDDRVGVQLGERLVDGLLHDGCTAEALLDELRGNLALAESGDLNLLADRLIRLVQARLELLGSHVDGQLDPRRVEGLDSALHSVYSSSRWDGLRAATGEAGRLLRPGASLHGAARRT